MVKMFKGEKEIMRRIGEFKNFYHRVKGKAKQEHIPDLFIKGVYLGLRLNIVTKGEKNEIIDILYYYDLDEQKIMLITVPLIVGKFKYAIKARSLRRYDLFTIKYLGKEISEKTLFEYNNYEVKFYDFEENGDIVTEELINKLEDEIPENYWDLFRDSEEELLGDKSPLRSDIDVENIPEIKELN